MPCYNSRFLLVMPFSTSMLHRSWLRYVDMLGMYPPSHFRSEDFCRRNFSNRFLASATVRAVRSSFVSACDFFTLRLADGYRSHHSWNILFCSSLISSVLVLSRAIVSVPYRDILRTLSVYSSP